MITSIRRAALALSAVSLLAACGHASATHRDTARAASSARAYATSPAVVKAEKDAEAHATACAKKDSTSVKKFVRCVAPKGTFPAVLHCVMIHVSFTHPVKTAEAAAPACVAAQETKAGK